MKRFLFSFTLFILLIFLLCFPQNALHAASDGLLLWYQNLLPVLFPFMILSNLMIKTDAISGILKFLHPFFHFLWGTSVYGSYAILAGYLFGYPMGAKVVHDLKKENLLNSAEAEYLIGFTNNLSPAFLITFLIHENLKRPKLLLPTLGILYGAPLLLSLFFSFKYRPLLLHTSIQTSEQNNKASKSPAFLELIDACISDGIITITRLGAYIILFSIIAAMFQLLPIKNTLLHCILNGCLEITTGVKITCQSSQPFFSKYLCLMGLCSFGGLCALMQTLSVCPMKGPMLRHYLLCKFFTICISLCLTLSLLL